MLQLSAAIVTQRSQAARDQQVDLQLVHGANPSQSTFHTARRRKEARSKQH
jgi:hypothetical protein